jgi:tetratricopeptide (TPR) repeat protein
MPREIEAALDARTADEWQVVRPGLERLADQPEGWLAQLLMARGAIASEITDEAQARVTQGMKSGPPALAISWAKNLARHEAQRGRRERARWYLDRIVESGLADASVCLAQAELCLAENRGETANSWLQRATELQPNSTTVLRNVGEIYFRLRNWESAANQLARALELGGGNSEVWQLRAACCAELARWEEAADDLNKAVQRNPRMSLLREQLAIALVSAGNMAEYRELCADTMAHFDFVDYQQRPWNAPSLLVLAPLHITSWDLIAFALDNSNGHCRPNLKPIRCR